MEKERLKEEPLKMGETTQKAAGLKKEQGPYIGL